MVLGANVSLSMLSVADRAVRFLENVWTVLPTGVVEGVLSSSSSSSSSVMKLGVEMWDVCAVAAEVVCWVNLSVGSGWESSFSSLCKGVVSFGTEGPVSALPEGGDKNRVRVLGALVATLRFRDALGDCVGVVRRGPSSEMALKCAASWLPVRLYNMLGLPQTLHRKLASRWPEPSGRIALLAE